MADALSRDRFDLRRSPRLWNQVPIRCKERDGQMSWWHMRSDGDLDAPFPRSAVHLP